MIYDGGSCNFMFHLAGPTFKIKSSYQIYWQLQLDNRKRSTLQERSPVGPTSVKLSDPARWPVSLYCIYLCIDHLYFQHPEGTERKCIYVLQQHHQILHWHLQQPESHQTSLKSRIQSVSQWEYKARQWSDWDSWNQITFWGGRWWEEQTWDTDPSAPGETWTLGQNPPSWSEEYCRDKEVQDGVLYVHKNTSECIYGQKRIGGWRVSRSTLKFTQTDDLRG